MTDPLPLQELLDAQRRPWWRRPRVMVGVALLTAVLATLAWWALSSGADAGPHYLTQPVTRGSLSVSVTATGTLQPTRSVAVGSELSGTVVSVQVDVNDRVRKGQVLVELDRARLADAVTAARAELDAARARRRQAEVVLKDAKATLSRLEQVAQLSAGQLPAAAELDTARHAVERSQADLDAASAAVTQSGATLSTAETSLSKAQIRSPIDGIVLARNVEPGNAVAASLQAVTLFTLAEDLRSMKLSVNVDEADVGQVKQGQQVRFNVAAQPGRAYPATVSRVAYGSTTTDNVVTYTTQIDVDNSDGSLRPGMTATAVIATSQRDNVLLVPTSALRFSPAAARAAASAATGGSLVSRLMPRPPGMGAPRRNASGTGSAAGNASREARLYLLRDGQAVELKVRRGLSDGRVTEVSGEGLSEGLAVIVDQVAAAH